MLNFPFINHTEGQLIGIVTLIDVHTHVPYLSRLIALEFEGERTCGRSITDEVVASQLIKAHQHFYEIYFGIKIVREKVVNFIVFQNKKLHRFL